MTDRVGQQLGNYRLLHLLGRGGFAEVYLGEHLYLKRRAALKVLHASLGNEDVAQFLAEAQTLARLDHPNIVRVHEFAVEQGTPFLAMDHAPGGTLRDRHPRGSCLSLATTVAYVKQIAAALQYAHNHHVIHRDIKPENMLLGPGQQVMLSDFGIALFSPSPEQLSTQAMAGTIPYMAPEQIRGKPTFASDQYSLGIVIYEWLCGVRPFEGAPWLIAYQQVFDPPPRLRQHNPSLPQAVEDVVLKALAKDPRERYVNVELFAQALERAISDIPFEPRNPYKGLRAFTQADAADFFGRDTLLQELLDMVKAASTSNARLLTVIGPSGSGKSSVVMAGLLPRLQQGAMSGSKDWVYLEPMVPGTHPLEALALTLAPRFPHKSVKTLHEDLQDASARGLHRLAAQLVKTPEQKVVLFIDQFEELFTLTSSEQEREQFIDLLVNAMTESQGALIVILTLRADLYDHPLSYRELGRLIVGHQFVVLPMEVHDLRAAIKRPAALPDVQLNFEGNLVGNLLFEVQGQAGALPLLQFTLEQLFARRSGHTLTLAAFREIGGVKGALARHAESTYAALPSEEHRKLARALFLRLIDPGFTEQDTTRRRAALAELSLPDLTQTKMLRETTDAFIAARLLTTNEHAGTTTIEVSHEALIREWPRLGDWRGEAHEDIRVQQTLSEDVAAWQQRRQPKDRLYRGSQLKEARTWAKRNLPSSNEVAFLRASAIQRMRFVASIIAIILLLMSTAGVAGWLSLHQPPDMTRVTNLQDDGVGSLRWAINNAPSGSTITFDQGLWGHTIVLTADLPIVQKHLSIRAPQGGKIIINSNGHQVHILSGVSLDVSNVIFTGGRTNFVSLLQNKGILTLINCTVSGQITTNQGGGGIYNDGGTLTLNESAVVDNTISGGDGGGGIYNSAGRVFLNNSVVSGNHANNRTLGGGIYNNNGTITISNSQISNNTDESVVVYGGGGIYNNDGTITISNSQISNNTTSTGGGGISNNGTMTLTKSTISQNTASELGGGIENALSGTLTLTESTVSSNTVAGTDLAIAGGGIDNAGMLTVTDSTISGNTVSGGMFLSNGGGIKNSGTLTLTNSTISGNAAANNGGGIFNEQGKAMLTFCTIYGNKAQDGGGIFNSSDTLAQGQVAMRNSLIAGSHASSHPDVAGPFFLSEGYNLIQSFSGATFTPNQQHLTDLSGDKFPNLGIDPLLRDNGGLAKPHTFTLALLPGSPAIDKIPLQDCQVKVILNSQSRMYTDQRGMKRPDENEQFCDIGAYESAA